MVSGLEYLVFCRRRSETTVRKLNIPDPVPATGNNPWNEKTGPKIERKADFMRVLERYNVAMI
jgi:hypothetical protein